MQDCLIFNLEINNKDSIMYKVKDNRDLKVAEKLAKQYDYNSKKGKLPIGVLYNVNQPTLVAQADHKILHPVRGIHLHDVPENRTPTNGQKGLGYELTSVPNTAALAAT